MQLIHKVVDALPHNRDHDAQYLVRKSYGESLLIDEYYTNKEPLPSGSLDLSTPTSNPNQIGTVGIDTSANLVTMETDASADNTSGTYVSLPLAMSPADTWTLRFKRNTLGTWGSDNFGNDAFIITVSAVAPGSLSHDGTAGNFQKPNNDDQISIYLPKNHLTPPQVERQVSGVKSLVSLAENAAMDAYTIDTWIDLVFTNENGNLGVKIVQAGGLRYTAVGDNTVPFISNGSVDFHLHSLGQVSGERLSSISVHQTDMEPTVYQTHKGILSSTLIKNGITGFNAGGVPVNSRILMQVMDTETTFPINAPDSVIVVGTAPTADVVFDIIKEADGSYGNPSTLGTITVLNGASIGTVALASESVIAVGDMLYIQSPSDTGGMKDLFINLLGFSEIPFHLEA